MVCRTCPQSGWPPSARVPSSDTRLDTVSADQFLLRTPGSGWPGDGHGPPLDRPVGRTSPVQWDHLADGSGPGPDSDGQAADTSRAQRPTMRPASRPQPTTRPTRPGPDRTGQQSACSPWPTPATTSIGTARTSPPAPMLDAGTSTSLVPVRCPRGSVRRPPWTPRSDSLPDTACPVVCAGHRPLHPARHGEPEATRTGNGRTARKAFGHPRSRRPKGGPPGTPNPLLRGGVCGLATKVGSAMARPPARP